MEPMSPVLPSQAKAKELEVIFAKNQPEYRPLPAIKVTDGTVITRWKLTWKERIKLLFSGNLFFQQLTFNDPLQPQLPSVEEPLILFSK